MRQHKMMRFWLLETPKLHKSHQYRGKIYWVHIVSTSREMKGSPPPRKMSGSVSSVARIHNS
jgi:hypothetical protein